MLLVEMSRLGSSSTTFHCHLRKDTPYCKESLTPHPRPKRYPYKFMWSSTCQYYTTHHRYQWCIYSNIHSLSQNKEGGYCREEWFHCFNYVCKSNRVVGEAYYCAELSECVMKCNVKSVAKFNVWWYIRCSNLAWWRFSVVSSCSISFAFWWSLPLCAFVARGE